jgi:hypothetical protein
MYPRWSVHTYRLHTCKIFDVQDREVRSALKSRPFSPATCLVDTHVREGEHCDSISIVPQKRDSFIRHIELNHSQGSAAVRSLCNETAKDPICEGLWAMQHDAVQGLESLPSIRTLISLTRRDSSRLEAICQGQAPVTDIAPSSQKHPFGSPTRPEGSVEYHGFCLGTSLPGKSRKFYGSLTSKCCSFESL